ncbi:MAG: hypothetical protein H6Q76_2415 [Firmicutes bacterium]|nr:hypothetical protein [Bacillota bacterium]
MVVQSPLPDAGKKISADELALERTMMAAERTLLAWVRTAMSFISFGFAMIKVLESLAQAVASKVAFLEANHVGLVLMIFGTGPLAVGMYQYYVMAVRLGKSSRDAMLNASFSLALVVLMLGILLFFNALFRWHLI